VAAPGLGRGQGQGQCRATANHRHRLFHPPLSPPLSIYLLIGAICLAAKTREETVLEHELTLDLNDAVIEQELRAERFRDIHRNR
jgi:hypothetical protein